MPTLEHQGVVDMFRQNPPLAPRLVEGLLHHPIPAHASVTVAESTLDQMMPVELQADLVLELRDSVNEIVLSLLVEAQRAIDPEKEFSWPSYLTALRSRNRRPVALLVVTSEPRVADWASRSIDLGLGLSAVRPLVLGPKVVPEVTDLAAAKADPELTLLSALAHGNGPHGLAVLGAAVQALLQLEPRRGAVYFRVLHDILRDPMKRALEKQAMEQMSQPGYKDQLPPFLREIFDQGEVEGEEKGKLEGKLEGKREALLLLMSRLGLRLSPEDQARIAGCTEEQTIERWFTNALGAKSMADVFRETPAGATGT
ncbi:MAG: hypothetical protein U0441_29935 [Polyangiaceae bacterium]